MKKVVVSLTGGFGNQCFLYAAGRGLALKYGARLVLLDMYKLGDLRQFALGDFNCKYEHKVRNGRIARRISAWLHAKRLAKAKAEHSCCVGNHYFDLRDVELRLPEHLDRDIYLDWFFQSEKFFKDYADQIAADFMLKDNSWLECDAMAAKIRATENAVFCHVRSYNDAVPDWSMSMPVEFFKNAAVALKEKIGGGTVFLFSDNLEWARERLEKSFTTNGFELIPVREDKSFLPLEKYTSEFLRDFTLMRLCHHAIVPNSTFSWWAAWLMEHECRSKGESPIVFRPGMGGAVKREEGPDFWPERWIAVSPV